MRLFALIIIAATASSATMVGCAAEKEAPETVQPTPLEVKVEFFALLETLDDDRPGAAVEGLQTFLSENKSYEIADTVRNEIERFRSYADGRYHEARELAREGRFERAEEILEDLAHLPDTPDGEGAREHLEFDYYLGKAQWLLMRQRYRESASVARALLEQDLTPTQANQVESILDNVGHVDAALAHAERTNAHNACRHVMVMLAQQFVEEGRYPSDLSIELLKNWDPHGSGSVLRALSSIEDYRASRDTYSFVAVSAQGQHRIRVVDGEIQD
jgi:tetratricopeptide (TPR) repeat protein